MNHFSTLLYKISIHALRGEGDFHTPPARRRHREFQSTPSVGRATFTSLSTLISPKISIHALRGEGDDFIRHLFFGFFFISIHALRGEGDLTQRA